MATRKVNKRPLNKTAIGDRRDRIGLYQRDVQPPGFDEYQIEEELTLLFERWAKVQSLAGVGGGGGRVIFDDIDTKEQPNLLFDIRFESGVTTETRIKWRDEWYEIKKVIIPEGRQFREAQWLYAKILGSTSKEANE